MAIVNPKIIASDPEKRVINEFVLRGTIVSTRPTRNSVSIVLATDAGSGIHETNYPNIVFRNKESCRGFLAGDHVTVTCHARTYTRRNENGKYEFPRELIGKSLKFTERILAENVAFDNEGLAENGGVPDDRNEGLIAGFVDSIYTPGENANLCIITLDTPIHGRHNRIDVACFNRQAHVAGKLAKGDWCIMAVTVRTLDQANFLDKNYHSINCKDIFTVKAETQVQELGNTERQADGTPIPPDRSPVASPDGDQAPSIEPGGEYTADFPTETADMQPVDGEGSGTQDSSIDEGHVAADSGIGVSPGTEDQGQDYIPGPAQGPNGTAPIGTSMTSVDSGQYNGQPMPQYGHQTGTSPYNREQQNQEPQIPVRPSAADRKPSGWGRNFRW